MDSSCIIGEREEIHKGIVELQKYGVEFAMENYLLRYPKRTRLQALKYAERVTRKKINKLKVELKNFQNYMENDNLRVIKPRTYDLS